MNTQYGKLAWVMCGHGRVSGQAVDKHSGIEQLMLMHRGSLSFGCAVLEKCLHEGRLHNFGGRWIGRQSAMFTA